MKFKLSIKLFYLQRKSRKWFFLSIACIFNFKVNAQLTNSNFEDFSQPYLNTYVQNPAVLDTNYSFCVRANQVINSGLFSNISKFYLDIDKKIRRETLYEKHFIGAQIVSSKYGDFISKSNLVFRYSWFKVLNSKFSISSGVSAGFLNLSFLTSNGGGGGTSIGPDASLGLRLVSKKFSLGISSNRIFNTVLIPLNQTFEFKRNFQLDLHKDFSLTPMIDFKNMLSVQTRTSGFPFYSFNSLLLLRNFAMISYTYNSLKKSSLGAGLYNWEINDSSICLGISYSIYHQRISVPDPSFEIYASFRLF